LFAINQNGSPSTTIVDWAPMIRQILEDQRREIPYGHIAAKFHNTLIETLIAVAHRVGEERVVLSGGCFRFSIVNHRSSAFNLNHQLIRR
jgi:hydrogenase maturation protein HypF